jgi:hypothetical protein
MQHQSFGDDVDEDHDEIDSNNFLTDSEGVSSSGYEDPGIHMLSNNYRAGFRRDLD